VEENLHPEETDRSNELFLSPLANDQTSCSGIQNLSLAFSDPVGSTAVNILPSDTPSDIYQIVADKTIIALMAIVASDQKTPEVKTDHPEDSDRPSDAQLAQWWLDFGITRKVTKRNCMPSIPHTFRQIKLRDLFV